MTAQLDLLLSEPSRPSSISRLPSPAQDRDTILRELERAAGRVFLERARAFVLSYLATHGPSSGEDITNACKTSGIRPLEGDDRAFGPVYMALARGSQIVKAGYCQRKKGHGTSGGNVWRIGGGRSAN
jgi:hypothetical protein